MGLTVAVYAQDGRNAAILRRLSLVLYHDNSVLCPIPRMHACIDSLGDAWIFSTLDANCPY